MSKKAVQGINYVRPPELKFTKKKETGSYTEYEIETFKNAKTLNGTNIYTRDIDTLIYCNPTITIKVPKPEYMKDKDSNPKFAYAIGMFPNPKNGEAAYLDGCILAALGLKRQQTVADVVCFITYDINEDDKKKLEVVFDKVIYVPYISPFDMGGEGDLKTILMDPKIFKNCKPAAYTEKHPYSHVFFKLHIFNPKLFPYEKVCFVDSDLVPMNYFDSLFMLDTPAGWVEYRKKPPYKDSFHWDRCDFLKHGDKIPKLFTEIDKPGGSDVNAGLMVISPNKKEYDAMIKELTSPLETWMGKTKLHKGFYDFDLGPESIDGRQYIQNSYCYPEQNYLTKRYSGKWTYIEFAFQSWTLDPCNSFGIHMAAFNPKPWFKQPIGTELNIKKGEQNIPYFDMELNDLPKAFVADKMDDYYENISYSYEIFNDLMVWGLLKYKDLKDFFLEKMEIGGPKISFDKDSFKKLTKDKDFRFIKDIYKTPSFKHMSISQKNICNLMNNYEATKLKLQNKEIKVCLKKKTNRYGENTVDKTIITWPKDISVKTTKTIAGKSASRKKKIKRKTNQRKIKTKKMNKDKQLLYFYREDCHWCEKFEKLWSVLKQNNDKVKFLKINGPRNSMMRDKYKVQTYPTLIKIENSKHVLFENERTLKNLKDFLNK